MKKISILVVGVLMLALVGCGNIQKVKVIHGSFKPQIKVTAKAKIK